jgi:hypothetical protein
MEPPFRPRTYTPLSSSELNNLYDMQIDSKHLRRQDSDKSMLTFSDYAYQFYKNEDLEQCIKLVREEIASKLENNSKLSMAQSAINIFTRNKLNMSSGGNRTDFDSSNAPQSAQSDKKTTATDSKDTSPVCRLGKNVTKQKKIDTNSGFSHEWHSPGKSVFKPFAEAVEEFSMIQNGDKILICLSGGKDSMSLLHAIRQYQFVAKSKVPPTFSCLFLEI